MSTPPEGVSGELRTGLGVLRATIVPGEARNQIRSVEFSGPFQGEAEKTVQRLQEVLAGALLDAAPRRIEDFFARNPRAVLGVEPGEFLTVLTLAYMRVRRTISSAPDPAEWKKNQT